jgi:hypothetical protein
MTTGITATERQLLEEESRRIWVTMRDERDVALQRVEAAEAQRNELQRCWNHDMPVVMKQMVDATKRAEAAETLLEASEISADEWCFLANNCNIDLSLATDRAEAMREAINLLAFRKTVKFGQPAWACNKCGAVTGVDAHGASCETGKVLVALGDEETLKGLPWPH